MGEVSARSVGDAFEGESRFVSEENRANLEEALEAAAAAAAHSIESGETDKKAYETAYDVQIEIEVREHNQHVKVYRVRITPGG
jgi:hypothetical protein